MTSDKQMRQKIGYALTDVRAAQIQLGELEARLVDIDAEFDLRIDGTPAPAPLPDTVPPKPSTGDWPAESEMLQYNLVVVGGDPTPYFGGNPAEGAQRFDKQQAAKLIIPYGNYTFDASNWAGAIGVNSSHAPANQHIIIQGALGPNGERPNISGLFHSQRRGSDKHSPSRMEWRNLSLAAGAGGQNTLETSWWREFVLTNMEITNPFGRNGLTSSTVLQRVIVTDSEFHHCGGSGLYHGIYLGGVDEVVLSGVASHSHEAEAHCIKVYANSLKVNKCHLAHYVNSVAPEDVSVLPLLDIGAYGDLEVIDSEFTRVGASARDRFIDIRNRYHYKSKYSNGFGLDVPGGSKPSRVIRGSIFYNQDDSDCYIVNNEGADLLTAKIHGREELISDGHDALLEPGEAYSDTGDVVIEDCANLGVFADSISDYQYSPR